MHVLAIVKNPLPCCSFVSIVVLDHVGEYPKDPRTLDAWAALDIDWWGAANIWDSDEPWSSVEAWSYKLGTLVEEIASVADLEVGVLYACQRWNATCTDGHSFLLLNVGDEVVQLDNTTDCGYRVRPVTIPQDGYTIKAVRIPDETE